MPPIVALVLTSLFVLWLLIRDARATKGTTLALWVPMIWTAIISSRFVSEWFGASSSGAQVYMEGSPIDQPIFLALILAAGGILCRRRVSLRRAAAANVAVAIFLGYGLLSILWSDFPWIAFKRWVKVVGHPMMALVILTEPNPKEALHALFRRIGTLLIPASVMLIKYFPEFGRGFSEWTGEAYNTGVTTNKNTLGALCVMVGLFFAWHFLVNRKNIPPDRRRVDTVTGVIMVAMTYWLMRIADCATATVSLSLGIGVMIVLGAEHLRKKQLLLYVSVAAVLYVTLDSLFGVTEAVIVALGRDPTLTDRTNLWEDVLAVPLNPVVGAGFESFWLGERLTQLWSIWRWRPNQAHSGYIETYINGGWLGVGALVVFLAGYYRRAKAELISSPASGRLKMAFLTVLLLTNYAEATFKALHPYFFLSFALMLDWPKAAAEPQLKAAPHSRRTFRPTVVKRPAPVPTAAAHVATTWRTRQAGR